MSLLALTLIPLIIFIILFSRTIYGFLLDEQPSTITKGQLGLSLIIEISYTPTDLEQWLDHLSNKSILFLLEKEWLERSPSITKLIIDKQFSSGLLLLNNTSPKDALKTYETIFKNKPIWVSCSPLPCSKEETQFFHASKINVIYTTHQFNSLNELKKLKAGSFIKFSLTKSPSSSLQSNIYRQLIQYPFLSIEENILGYSFKQKSYP